MHQRAPLLVPSALFLFAFSALAGSATGDELLASGEFQVNTYTSGPQAYPSVAIGSNGDFLIAWEGEGTTDASGAWGRRFDADGTPLAGEFRINTATASYQWFPAVSSDDQGNFVVTWDSGGAQDGDLAGIFGQILDEDTSPVGDEFQVNTYTPNYQRVSDVAMRGDGSFLVVWRSLAQDFSDEGVYARIFDSGGLPIGDDFQVAAMTVGDQEDARVAATPDGFVVVWESELGDGNNEGVLLQRYDAVGAAVGGETVVNSFTFGDQVNPDVAVAPDGTMAIVWEDTTQEGNGDGVVARIYDSSGATVGGELQLNTYTTNDQENPRVAADGLGGFLAVWESKGQVGDPEDEDIFGQRFDAFGSRIGGEFQVNVQATDDQEVPSIAGRDGRFVVVWHSWGQDGGHLGSFARTFEVALFADGFETGDTSAWGAE